MEQQKIDRINELARASRQRELTEAERAEQKALRDEYIADFRKSMGAILDNTSVQYPDGTKVRLKQKSQTDKNGGTAGTPPAFAPKK